MGQQPPNLLGKQPLAPDFAPGEINGAFYGLDEELANAPYRAALTAGVAVNILAAPFAGITGQEAQDRWFAAMVDEPLRTLEQLDQRSAINGTGARVIGELGRIALLAPLGPAGLGTVETATRFGRAARAGKDDPLALGAAAGATLAVGFALPFALPVRAGWGPALLQRMGYGIGANVALGVGQRGAEAALGEDVDPLDGLALTLDAALGAFFGGAAHIHGKLTAESTDAAMVMVEQASAQRVVPPGEAPQPHLDHLAAKQRAALAGQDLPDPPVPAAAAKLVDDQATAAETSLRASEPALARLEEPGAGQPEPLPKVEPAPSQAAKADVAPQQAEIGQHARLAPEQRGVLSGLYTAAARARPEYERAMTELAAAVGGRLKMGPLKGVARSVEKILDEEGGDFSKLRDLVRGTIEVDSIDDLMRAVAAIQGLELVGPPLRNFYAPGAKLWPTRYRDVKANVRIAGHDTEIQVNLPEMLAAKEGAAHPLYERQRTLEGEGKTRALTDAERAEIADLVKRQAAIYDEAFATIERKAASSIGEPLRMAEVAGNQRGAGPSKASAVAPSGDTATGTPSTSPKIVPGGKDLGTGIDSTSTQNYDITGWKPASADGEAVALDLPALQQTAAQLDALGLTVEGRKASEVLAEAVKSPGAVDEVLDAVTTCAMNYGH